MPCLVFQTSALNNTSKPALEDRTVHPRADADRIETRREHARRGPLVILAGLALLLGTFMYMVARPAGVAWLLPAPLNFGTLFDIGIAGHGLPTLLHAYAFLLLSAAVLRPRRPGLYTLCAGGFALEALFELGQHPAVARLLEATLPAGADHAPLLGRLLRYFQHGVFDPLDLACAFLGVAAAGITVSLITQPGRSRDVCVAPQPR